MGNQIGTRSRFDTGAWDRQGGANAQSTPNAGKGRRVRRHGRDDAHVSRKTYLRMRARHMNARSCARDMRVLPYWPPSGAFPGRVNEGG